MSTCVISKILSYYMLYTIFLLFGTIVSNNESHQAATWWLSKECSDYISPSGHCRYKTQGLGHVALIHLLICQSLQLMSTLKISTVFGGGLLAETPSGKVIFVKYFRHWRTGKIIYPKNGNVIAIKLKEKPNKQ